MPSLTLFGHFLRELVTRDMPARLPEPALLMDDPAQVAAYVQAGRVDGPVAPNYLFHSQQACRLIRPGDCVVDLACGPATQLCQLAQLNPQAHFIGVDLSPTMLAQAQAQVLALGLQNVSLREGDITRLADMPDACADVVISTMSLHHLPDQAALAACCEAALRILQPGGAMYLADFVRLKREETRRHFAQLHPGQSPLFVADYLNSLRAAFSLAELRVAALPLLSAGARLISNPGVPLMGVIATPPRVKPDAAQRAQLRALWLALDRPLQRDFNDIRLSFMNGPLRDRHPARG